MTERPNVLLLVVDACRADYVSPYSESAHTPAIESLADEGTVFRRAVSPAPWTLPSVTSLLTGVDPHRHGATARGFESDARTLVDDLSAVGYECVHVSPTTWIGDWVPQGQGFDRVEEFTGPTHRYFDAGADVRDLSEGVARGLSWYTTVFRRALKTDSRLASVGNTLAFKLFEATSDVWRDDIRASETAAERVDDVFGDMANRDDPFFAYVHLMDPHLPLYVPREFESDVRPPDCDSREAEHAYMEDLMDDIWAIRAGERTLTEDELAFLRTRYADAVTYADSAIGSMLDSLSAHGLADETLVAVTGDHGEHLGERVDGRTLLDHQLSIRFPLLRVPLVVRSPERFGDDDDESLVQTHYLAATVRDLAGLQSEPRRSLSADAEDRRSSALAEYRGVVPSHPPAEYETDEWFTRRITAIEGEWKLDVVGSRRRAAHIDWESNETRSVSPAAIPGAVRESLEETLSGVTRTSQTRADDDAVTLPEDVTERLDDLGYR